MVGNHQHGEAGRLGAARRLGESPGIGDRTSIGQEAEGPDGQVRASSSVMRGLGPGTGYSRYTPAEEVTRGRQDTQATTQAEEAKEAKGLTKVPDDGADRHCRE
jgi:hypothetical protein